MLIVTDKIRLQRRKKGLTLKELAKKINFSISYLSGVERGKNIPSISMINKLSKVLDIHIEQLVNTFNDDQKMNEIINIVSKNKRRLIIQPHNKIKIELLVDKVLNNTMQPLYVIVPVGVRFDRINYKGEEFGYILKGKLQIITEIQNAVIEADDSFYLSSTPYSIINIGNTETHFLWVVTSQFF